MKQCTVYSCNPLQCTHEAVTEHPKESNGLAVCSKCLTASCYKVPVATTCSDVCAAILTTSTPHPTEDSVAMDKQSELTGELGLWRVSPLTTALGAELPVKERDSTQCHTQGATLVVQ